MRGQRHWKLYAAALLGLSAAAGPMAREGMVLSPTRRAQTDLEVAGSVAGLRAGQVGYLSEAQMLALPQVRTTISGDGNFPESIERTMRVQGVRLRVLADALGATAKDRLMSALCTDRYEAHYPADYVRAHDPILVLRVNGLRAADWARRKGQEDPGPFFVTHARFVPAFRVLAHADEAQVPTNVVRIGFGSERAVFGAIAPSLSASADLRVEQGFQIARQNCLRCHFLGESGGTKSGRDWRMLGTWAREQPAFFAGYVRDPKRYEKRAKMPANAEYDDATLSALTVYFREFGMGKTSEGRR